MTAAASSTARRASAAVALGVTLLLAACTPPNGAEELEELFDDEQQAQDVLPDPVVKDVAVDGETTRRLGTHEEATLYAAQSNEGAATCLVIVDQATDARDRGVSSCTMAPNPTGTEVSNGTNKAMFVMPGTDFSSLEQSGWTRLGDFLAVG